MTVPGTLYSTDIRQFDPHTFTYKLNPDGSPYLFSYTINIFIWQHDLKLMPYAACWEHRSSGVSIEQHIEPPECLA